MNDLVSYDHKHNEANGENGRDGSSNNYSWNCGVEGPADDPAIEALRNRQVKNFMTLTLLSLGVPMLLMGDEVRRTQYGNNNAYALDNETSWFDWTLVERHADVHRFATLLIARRVVRETAPEQNRTTLNELLRAAAKSWHGIKINKPDWSPWSHSLAFEAELRRENLLFHMIWNAYWEPLEFELPAPKGGPWRRWIDTGLESPYDIVRWQEAPVIGGGAYRAGPRSAVVLYSRPVDRNLI
jgi:glycogen operon protein